MGLIFNFLTGEFDFVGSGAAASTVASQNVFTVINPITGDTITANTLTTAFSFTSTGGLISIVGSNTTSSKFLDVNVKTITVANIFDITESVQDFIFPYVTAGSSKISLNYTDTANFFAIDVAQGNIDHNALLNYTTTQHFTIAQISITASQVSDFTEAAQDVIFPYVTVGSTKITLNYTDAANFFAIDVNQGAIDHNSLLNYTTTQHFTIAQISITASQVSDFTEAAQDVIFPYITVGSSKVALNYTDAANFFAIDINQGNIDHNALLNYTTTQHFLISQISITASQVSDFTEAAQDVTFGYLTVGSGISFNYTDSANFLQISHAQVSTGDLHQDYILAKGTRDLALNTTTAFSINLQSTGDFQVQDNGVTMWIFNDSGNLFANTTTALLQFATTTSKVYANANNQITIEADTTNVGKVTGDIALGDSVTLIALKPNTDLKVDLGTSSLTYRNVYVGNDIIMSPGANIVPETTVGTMFGDTTTALISFFAATPRVQCPAFTQTYSTASLTVPVNTSNTVATTATTNVAPFGFTTQAQGDNLITSHNAVRTDVDNVRKVCNQIINYLKTTGGLGLFGG